MVETGWSEGLRYSMISRRVQGLCIGVDVGIDPVGHHPLRERLAVRGIHRRHLCPRGQGKQQGAEGRGNSDSMRNCREGMRHSRSFLRGNAGQRPDLGAQEPSEITAVMAGYESRGGAERQRNPAGRARGAR